MKKKHLLIGLFIIYLFALTYIIVLKDLARAIDILKTWSYDGMIQNVEHHINLIPFETFRMRLTSPQSLSRYIIPQIVIFIPFGVLLPAILHNHRSRYFITLFSGLLLSIGFEWLQVMTRLGSGDIDDVILNGAGAMIGYHLFRSLDAIYQKVKQYRS